jgi:1-acyl-sn-glycerol-3-phosphate acyltransferase
MRAIRFARVMLHLLKGLGICAFLFPFADGAQRARYNKRWSAGLLAILRIEIQLQIADGVDIHRAGLVVANHVSWLDIFIINAVSPCRFVAKADIRHWPVIGWLCAQGGTIFIARGRQREVRRVYQGLVDGLEANERIAFFPEGTTAAQGELLPFHASLFEAAIEARLAVQPCALRYVDRHGSLHKGADFVGDMSFAESVLLIIRSEPMTAQLMVLPAIETTGAQRRELAQKARSVIGSALGYTNQTRSFTSTSSAASPSLSEISPTDILPTEVPG